MASQEEGELVVPKQENLTKQEQEALSEVGQEAVEEEVDQPHQNAEALPNEDEAGGGYALEDELGKDVEYEERENITAPEELEYRDENGQAVEYPVVDHEEDYEVREDEMHVEDDDGVAQEEYRNEDYQYFQGSAAKRQTRDDVHGYNGRMGDEGFIEEGYDDDYSVNQMFKRKQRRNKHKISRAEIQQIAQELVDEMEIAADRDLQLHGDGEVALEKLKLIPKLEETLIRRDFQKILLAQGILGVLKAWIEPLSDGSLPNIKVRTTVLKCLGQLPIDTREQDDRDLLRLSDIGSRVMFLSKISSETRENKKLARALVEQWSRPIFEEAQDDAKHEEMVRDTLAARKRRLDLEREDEQRSGLKKLKPGDPGYRHTASIPAPSRLDYVIKPDSKVNPEETRIKSRTSPVMLRLNRMQRNKTIMQGRSLQAARPSIEGKGL